MKKHKKVYLSIKGASAEDVKKLIEKLEENGCEVKTSELECQIEVLIESEKDEQFIAEEIEWCDLVFVLIGASTEENKCVNREIEEASNQDKKIVGIYMGGGSDCVPSALESFGEGLIINDVIRILSVVNDEPVTWESPVGVPRKPKNNIDIGDC